MARSPAGLISVAAVVSAVLLCGAVGSADPFPDWNGTIADPNSYDQTVACEVIGGYYVYEWEITYTNSPSIPDDEVWFGFGVYGDTETLRGYVKPSTIDWSYTWTSTTWAPDKDGSSVALEWKGSPSEPYGTGGSYYPGATQTFGAQFTEELPYGGTQTAIHIKWGIGQTVGATEFFNNTPELPPSALLGLTTLPLGLAYIQGRRRRDG